MHSSCILDFVANLLVCHMVSVGNAVSHFKGLDPSFEFCCQGPDERPHQLNLRSKRMFLSLHRIFSLERAAVVWAMLERISGLDLWVLNCFSSL